MRFVIGMLLVGCGTEMELEADQACITSRGTAEDAAAAVEGLNCPEYGALICDRAALVEGRDARIGWNAICPSGGTPVRIECYFERFGDAWGFNGCAPLRY